MKHNKDHDITPQALNKVIKGGVVDILKGVKNKDKKVKKITSPDQIEKRVKELEVRMKKLSKELDFEQAAKVRDEIKELKSIWLLSGKEKDEKI